MNENFKITNHGQRQLHEGASKGRRLGNWGTRKVDPTEEAATDLSVLRDRSRALRRDNAWTSRGNNVDCANIIGTGVVPVPSTDDESWNEAVSELLLEWVKHVDYSGTDMNLYTIQAQLQMARREAGEVFMIAKKGRLDRTSASPVPLQFQILEADYCPEDLNMIGSGSSDIVNGVEVNRFGQVQAFWFYKEHPDSTLRFRRDISNYIRVPKNQVIHYFKQDRPNQLRATPTASNSIVTARTFDIYNDAELVRKESRAAITGVIERDHFTEEDFKYDPMSGQPIRLGENDVPELDLQNGTFQSLLAGEKLHLYNADDSGVGYKDYQTFQLLQIAASHGVPYQLLTGDWSGINDRVWRAIFNQYKREVQQEQALLLNPRVNDVVYREFIDRAILSGQIGLPKVKTEYGKYKVVQRAQAFEYIHPEQDINTDIKKLQAGLMSRRDWLGARGNAGESIEKIDADRNRDAQSEDGYGLKSLANNSVLADVQEVQDDSDSSDKDTKDGNEDD